MVTDRVANLVVALQNASAVRKATVVAPHTKLLEAIAAVLKKEGFIEGYEVKGKSPKLRLEVTMRYTEEGPAIREASRVSKFSRRFYAGAKELRPYRQGYGMRVLTTPKGVMSDRQARRERVGGEVLCQFS